MSQTAVQPPHTSPRDSPATLNPIDAMGPFAMGGAIGRDAAVSLIRAVAESPQLRTLDLRSSKLSKQAVQRLSHFVRQDQLIGLSMADCFLGETAEPLLSAVSVCTRLVWLNLRLNGLTDCITRAGGNVGIELCGALRASVSLTDVDMASNELSDDFGECFASVLRLNEVLWKVDLFRNPLGIRTGNALLDVLQHNNSTLVSIGDTVEGFFGLGMQNRYQIQCHLDANRKGFGVGYRPVDGLLPDVMDPSLADFEWHILEDDHQVFMPLMLPGR